MRGAGGEEGSRGEGERSWSGGEGSRGEGERAGGKGVRGRGWGGGGQGGVGWWGLLGGEGSRSGGRGVGVRGAGVRGVTSSLSRMRPSSGLDIDHWLRQSSNMMMFNTVDSIYKRNDHRNGHRHHGSCKNVR